MIITIHSPKDLANHLKDLRKKYKVTQKELAIEVEVNAASIGRYEMGLTEISVNTYFKICQFFVNRHIKETLSLSLKPENDNMTTKNSDSASTSSI